MIVTVTLNPAPDLTYRVDALVPHGTHRVAAVAGRPGGKGINALLAIRTPLDHGPALGGPAPRGAKVYQDLSNHSANGFGSVMYDASKRTYAANVAATAAAVRRGHARGLWVESELGQVGGKDGAHAPGVRTDPVEAAAYVAATGVDALAVAVGSSHAMHSRTARLDHELIGRLRAAVPVPLVLHGSSGVPDDELIAAVRGGMAKVNIGTALNSAFTGAVRETLDGDATLVDPRAYLTSARTAMAATVADALRLLAATTTAAR